MKISHFLRASRETLINSTEVRSNLVFGNESGDLDSTISSIAYAYYMAEGQKQDYVPVMNTTKEKLEHRYEVLYCLESMGVSKLDLLFLDELQNKESLGKITLVDHHQPNSKFKALGYHKLVDTVIDHHPDTGEMDSVAMRVVDPSVGSCATLITEKIKKLSLESATEIAFPLLSTIISDTSNFNPKLGRTSNRDIEAVDFLFQLLQCSKSKPMFLEENYETILAKKIDESNLPTKDILAKDFKEYITSNNLKIGVSAANLSFEHWMNREGKRNFLTELHKFDKEHSFDLFIVMTTFKTGKLQCEMLIMCDGEFPISFSKMYPEVECILEETGEINGKKYTIFKKSTLVTRKRLMPMIFDYLQNFI